MIPKIIHYVWFSDAPLPELQQKCLDSWGKHCPDYKIKRWNADNFNVNCCNFVKEAYAEKKWAFVTDYVRLYALYCNGGIYLDTDVFLCKSLDKFLNDSFFTCIEKWNFKSKANFQAAFMGAEKGHPFLEDCMKKYDKMHYNNECKIAPIIFAACAEKYGYRYENVEQYLDCGMHIYNEDICASNNRCEKAGNYAVHYCAGGWTTEDVQYAMRMCNNHTWLNYYLARIIGMIKIYGVITTLKSVCNWVIKKK